ncbi:hypothetical protein EsH8_V_000901 [Colletotrichum jinshuiense]
MRFNFVLVAWAALAAPFMGATAAAIPEPDMSLNLSARQTMELQGSGFAATCNSFSLNSRYPTLLYATCRTISGAWKTSHVDLMLCLANSCGRLVPSLRGRYGDSCDKPYCSLSGTWFQCNCRDCGGVNQFTGINLNDVVGNDNGDLECYGLKQLG